MAIKELFSNKYLKFTSIFMATTALLGSVWAAGDYTGVRPIIKNEFIRISEVQQQISQSILLMRFQIIRNKREVTGTLTFDELQEMCQIAQQLNYFGIPECTRLESSRPPLQ